MGNVFSNIGHAIGKGVTDAGHFVGKVADNPWTKAAVAAGLAATGVGAPAAAAIMAAEGAGGGLLRPGGTIGSGITGGATGALEGYGAGKVGAALHAGGLAGVARALPGASAILPHGGGATGGTGDPVAPTNINLPVYGVDGQPEAGGPFVPGGAGDVGQLPAGTPAGTGASGGDGGNWYDPLLSGAKSVLGGGGGGGGGGGVADLAMAGLAGASALTAANAAKRAGGFQDQAIDLANQNWAAGAPLRTAGTAGLLHPARPDLSSTYVDPSNPFASRPRPIGPAAPAPAPSSPTGLAGMGRYGSVVNPDTNAADYASITRKLQGGAG